MKQQRVLLIGISGYAATRFYVPQILPILRTGSVAVVCCDVVEPPPETAVLGSFIRCPEDWKQWRGDEAQTILGSRWDLVLVVTPPQSHCAIAQVVAESQVQLGQKCSIILEKPVDTNPQIASQLVGWLDSHDPYHTVKLYVLDHYAHGKWAIDEVAHKVSALQMNSIKRAYFVSYEQSPMWASTAFQEGYLLEHAAGHAPASLDKAVGGIIDISLGKRVVGGRYITHGSITDEFHLQPPTEFDTWSCVDLVVDCPTLFGRQIPFLVTVGKGMGVERNEKWLRLDGKTTTGSDISLWADIDRRKVFCTIDEQVQSVTELSQLDGYSRILPEILSGSPERIANVTVPFEKALEWLMPFSLAATQIRSALIPYNVGNMPLGAREILAEVKNGLSGEAF